MQRWKLEGNKLKNKKELWLSDEPWNFIHKTDLTSETQFLEKTKVLGITIDGKVIKEAFKKDRAEQVWKKGKDDKDGYFTLQNSKVPKIMTAISPNSSEIKGKITLS